MVECPNCHTRHEGAAAFCGGCGARLPEGPLPLVPADPLLGLVVDGRYRILDLIGRGGMGSVYRAEHTKMGKVLAIKLLHGELSRNQEVARRFRLEAEAVSRLSHLNTVSVFDFGSHEGMMYLVMEYIDGRDLSEVLRRDGPLPAARVCHVLVQVCSALIEAHAKGIVHRDLKPENILVSQQFDYPDFVKVLDFGLAKLKDFRDKTKITRDGNLVGTPYYMAPEHIRGEGVDPRSDVYSLGAVMYKLLTGETPFSSSTPMGVLTKHLTEEVAPPSVRFPKLGIPPQADAIVLRAMAKRREERYASAEELRCALADLGVRLDPSSRDQRFSSFGDGGPAARAMVPVADPDRTPVVTAFPLPDDARPSRPGTGDQAANRGRNSTITVGSRELAVGTRSDFFTFERRLRRRRVLGGVLAGVLFLAAAGAAGFYALFVHGADQGALTAEREPNDTPAQAGTLAPGVQLLGSIAGGDERGDVDWYRLPSPHPRAQGGVRPAPWGVSVELTGVPGLDLALQLVDPSRAEPLAVANRGGQGQGESVPPLRVEADAVYLMVQEVRRPGVPPASVPQVAYGLTYRVWDATFLEAEPNDTRAQASPVRKGVPISGTLTGEDDADWYCLPASETVAAVTVTPVANRVLRLTAVVGPGGNEIRFPDGSPGVGATATLPAGPGPVCVGLRAAAIIKLEGDDVADAPYQITFQ
jgi:serine/threonine-protein kinase